MVMEGKKARGRAKGNDTQLIEGIKQSRLLTGVATELSGISEQGPTCWAEHLMNCFMLLLQF